MTSKGVGGATKIRCSGGGGERNLGRAKTWERGPPLAPAELYLFKTDYNHNHNGPIA